MRSTTYRKLSLLLVPCAVVALLGFAGGCSLDLGEIPFRCNKGEPKCPEGYKCTDNKCHREDECPASIKSCPRPADGGGGGGGDKGVINPNAPPRGKFCNGLQKKDSSKFNMILKIGGVSLKALTGLCSSCTNLPAGKSNLTLLTEGQSTPDLTGTVTMEKGKEYIFWSQLDSTQQVELDGGALKPEYKCETVDPFKP